MSAVSTPATPPTLSTLLSLISFCQTIVGRNDADSYNAFALYLNQSQKDYEMEFPDHTALQKSQQIALTAPINGIGQDTSYDFFTTAPDFRKERLLRIESPVNYSRPLLFMDYVQYRLQVTDYANATMGLPRVWYWAPEDPSGFHVWPLPDQAYTAQFDYIAYAPELLNPTDTPFMDREFHKNLCYRALFYWYNSDPINLPDKGAQWDGMYQVAIRKYKKDQQRRQMQLINVPYGTGVNEGLKPTTPPIFFH